MESDEDLNFSVVVDTLNNMFGDVIARDVIITVVESCGGDLSLAADAIMNISATEPSVNTDNIVNDSVSDCVSVQENENSGTIKQEEMGALPSTTINMSTLDNIPKITTTHALLSLSTAQDVAENILTSPPQMSYSSMSRSGAVPKQKETPKAVVKNAWPDHLRNIITHHIQGSRTLIFVRGAPGSGKSYLAREIVAMTVGSGSREYKTHIFSTDDFFTTRGKYLHDKSRLSFAHLWNQERVRGALMQGMSPIIVDNTNIQLWEMLPYLRDGLYNGYIVEVVEPNTPWAKIANQLFRRNIHNVPMATIRKMLDNFVPNVTGASLLQYFGLTYPPDMIPPVLRWIPRVKGSTPEVISSENDKFAHVNVLRNDVNEVKSNIVNVEQNCSVIIEETHVQNNEAVEIQEINTAIQTKNVYEQAENIPQDNKYLKLKKQYELLEQVEREWDDGETWEELNQNSQDDKRGNINITKEFDPKPPRKDPNNPYSNLLETVQNCNDWSQISMYMPPWSKEDQSEYAAETKIVAEKSSIATSVEFGDTDIQNSKHVLKIITAVPRDINEFYLPLNTEKIPQERMLDKSTMTNELQNIQESSYRCQNEGKHFVAFRKLFKNIPKADLFDVFEKCGGDVNWAVDIVLEGISKNLLKTLQDEELSDSEDELPEHCNCVAAYSVIPDAPNISNIPVPSSNSQETLLPNNSVPKKGKVVPSENSLQLKHQIEKNVVISDQHYSDHCLKIRKLRRGETDNSEEIEANLSTDKYPQFDIENIPLPGTSQEGATYLKEDKISSNSDSEESLTSGEGVEGTVNINVGRDFISQLDELFGRKDMLYPENIVPRINIPLSLLNEINAFWMESLMYQMNEHDKQKEKMVLEDAEIALQMELKEIELAEAGKEPEVPDFKEIMDMDFAVSLYQKNVAEWQNKAPTDMAAKMTRDKLYNLFPDMSQDVLLELLMAHDNNFQATVEVLLMSTGRADIVQEKDGVNKFVMKKELERQEKLLEEEKKALREIEWPLLPKGEGEIANMAMVESYRTEARKHLTRRNLNFEKAKEYIRKGMTPVATSYSEMARYHQQRFEQANSMAVVTLVQVHATNRDDNATIDLHYLHVAEAKESLDLFLDTHIQKLKEDTSRPRYQVLFFITGRGLHSHGKPRIKPAVKKRLKQRGLQCTEKNPGLLQTRVCADSKLSYELGPA